jgi:hypothetical protein
MLLVSGYDLYNEETILVYNMTQLGGRGVIDHATLSWSGKCCVRDTSYLASSIDYGLDQEKCQYSIMKYDKKCSNLQQFGFYKIMLAGKVPIVEDAVTVAIQRQEGFCLYSLPGGPDCSKCGGQDTDAPSSGPSKTLSATPSDCALPTPDGLGFIAGRVQEDTDNDNFGEVDFVDVTVILSDGAGSEITRNVTNGDGSYIFEGLPAGNFMVSKVNLPDFSNVSDADGGSPNKSMNALNHGQ